MQPSDDTPSPRTIRIGSASVGLIGLDQAMAKAMESELPPEKAADFLLTAIGKSNYIPDSARPLYQEALLAEYQRRLGHGGHSQDRLTIRVLGSGCVTCNKLSTMLYTALASLNLAADMESVHDLDEIGRFGVTKTPALLINSRVKCAGRMPTQAEVEEWLAEEAERTKKGQDTPS